MIRVGNGFDVHPLVAGRRLVLGGVEVPHDRGLDGHSDADVVCHALIDALLGAAALGDIGSHFASSDPALRDASSVELLRQVRGLLASAGYAVVNIDATVVIERPRLHPHIPAMRAALAAALGVTLSQVSVKATTSDGLGLSGREEGVAALAVVLVETE